MPREGRPASRVQAACGSGEKVLVGHPWTVESHKTVDLDLGPVAQLVRAADS